jgi:outer membrane protein OmpA-like peptidoglycan-associated protein
MTHKLVTSLLTTWMVLALASGVLAQTVHRLRGAEATSDKLIDVLKPHGTRGLKPVSGPPQCKAIREQRARGISPPTATSDMAAIDVQFAYNSAELSPSATRTLDELGKALTSDELASSCFQIEGHTDSTGTEEYNQRLSERRAQSVVRYLIGHFGIDSDRLIAVGYGESRPIASNDTDDGRAQNRRVQVGSLAAASADAQ